MHQLDRLADPCRYRADPLPDTALDYPEGIVEWAEICCRECPCACHGKSHCFPSCEHASAA